MLRSIRAVQVVGAMRRYTGETELLEGTLCAVASVLMTFSFQKSVNSSGNNRVGPSRFTLVSRFPHFRVN